MDRPSVSDQLRKAIQECPLSQNQIARNAGVDPGVLSRFMRGERGITDETFSKLCKFLRLELRPIEDSGD